jgi:hypothetical protein
MQRRLTSDAKLLERVCEQINEQDHTSCIPLHYAVGVIIFGGSEHNIKVEALVVAIKKSALEVHADNTKYMGMSRDQNAGRRV